MSFCFLSHDVTGTNPTYLPTGDPIQTSLPIDKQYGMLLTNAPSQLPVLLTQVASVGGSSFDNMMFIGNYLAPNIVGYYLTITIVDAQPSPPNGFHVYLEQISSASRLRTVDPVDPHHPDNYVPPIMYLGHAVTTTYPLPLAQSSDPYPLGSPGD